VEIINGQWHKGIHTYHSRFISEGVAETSQILEDIQIIPKLPIGNTADYIIPSRVTDLPDSKFKNRVKEVTLVEAFIIISLLMSPLLHRAFLMDYIL
jgi:hypothetical protein